MRVIFFVLTLCAVGTQSFAAVLNARCGSGRGADTRATIVSTSIENRINHHQSFANLDFNVNGSNKAFKLQTTTAADALALMSLIQNDKNDSIEIRLGTSVASTPDSCTYTQFQLIMR